MVLKIVLMVSAVVAAASGLHAANAQGANGTADSQQVRQAGENAPQAASQGAQQPAAESAPPAEDLPKLLPRVGVFGETPLTLQEVIVQVLAHNHDIEISAIDREMRVFDVRSAQGAYDPRIGLDGSWQKAVTPVASVIGGSASGSVTQRQFVATPHLNGLIPGTGGSYRIDVSSSRLTTDNQFVTLNPQYPASLSFNLTQPLWRGLLFDDNRRQVAVSKKNQSLSDEQFRQAVMDSVTQAAQAYWELVFATRNLQVQADAVAYARKQVESNQRMSDQGVLAPIDVVEAQTQLSNFEQSVFLAQDALTRAENALKTLMLPDRNSPVWSTALVPVTPPRLIVPPASLDEAVKDALANRPELAQVKISSDINDTNSRFYHEQTKPQVNLVATYTAAGLAGTELPAGPNPFTSGLQSVFDRIDDLSDLAGLPPLPPISFGGGGVPAILVGGYSQSFANLLNRRFPTTSVGLQISVPLRNRTAEANYGASLAEGRRIEAQRAQLEEGIEADVRNAMQSVQSAKARLASAQNERRSAGEQYESEQRKFQAGTSTVFLVLQRQTAMIAARSRELRAQADLDKAVALFDRVTAQTLEAYNVKLENGTAGRQP